MESLVLAREIDEQRRERFDLRGVRQPAHVERTQPLDFGCKLHHRRLRAVVVTEDRRVPVELGVEVGESGRGEVVERADDGHLVGGGVGSERGDGAGRRWVVVEAVVVALHPDGRRDEHRVVELLGDRLDGVGEVVGGDGEDGYVGAVGRHLVDEPRDFRLDAVVCENLLILVCGRTRLLRVARAEDDVVVGVVAPPERESLPDIAGAAKQCDSHISIHGGARLSVA